MEISDADNWHYRKTKTGFRWIGFQPTHFDVAANPDCVILSFKDNEVEAGVSVVLTHESFRDYLLMLTKARETFETKQEE
jgi:hypothetical protein